MASITQHNTQVWLSSIVLICFALLLFDSGSVHAATTTVTLKNGKTFEVKTKRGSPRPVKNRYIEMTFMGPSFGTLVSDTPQLNWSWSARLKKKGRYTVTVTTPVDDAVSVSFEATGPGHISYLMFDGDNYPTLWSWIDDDEETWFPFVYSFEDTESDNSFEIMQWGIYPGEEVRAMMARAAARTPEAESAQEIDQSKSVAPPFDERDWQLGHKAIDEDDAAVWEYVLDDETVENWSELITVQSFAGLQDRSTPEDMMLALKQSILTNCPDGMWNIVEQADDEIVYEFRIEGCAHPTDSDDQYEIGKILKGSSALHVVSYTTKRQPHLPETERSEWINRIDRVKVTSGGSSETIEVIPETQTVEVIFTREGKGGPKQWDVLMDETPVATLGRRSYISIETKPGWHLIWGDCQSEWFEFLAGRTYLIRVLPDYPYPCNVDYPGLAESLVAESSLEHVMPTEDSLEALDAELSKYTKIKRKAGSPPTDGDKMEVKKVSYKTELSKFSALFGGKAFVQGTLTITDSTLLYQSKKQELKIPTADILSFAPIVAPTGTYIAVEYRESGTSRTAYFFVADGLFKAYNANRAVVAIQNSLPLQR